MSQRFLACLIIIVFGLAIAASLHLVTGPLRYIGVGLAGWLSIAAYIDARRFLLLDVLTLPLVLAGLVLSVFGLGPGLLDASLGAALGYGVFWAVSEFYLRVRGIDGLGLGDAKLLAAAGAWCGALQLPFVVLIGSLSALLAIAVSVLRGRSITAQTKLPFGPFLSLGYFVVWVMKAHGGLT